MRILFILSVILLIAFEILNVYFIMPMPGSQESETISIAYFLYSNRWIFRIILAFALSVSFIKLWLTKRKWLLVVALIPVIGIAYLFNFIMVADKMFLQPENLVLVQSSENKIPLDRQVLGIELNGKAKAYPIEFLAYHHQVKDQIANKNIIVTYCSVCRTGRIFDTELNGKNENFRLVGMDHFNAMFEDETTGSWWRQVNGEAISGPSKGQSLTEIPSNQMTLEQWLKLFPESYIMQADPKFMTEYDDDAKFEKGLSKSTLTGTNHESWTNKSWVLGVVVNGVSKAYDWNLLKSKRMIRDHIGQTSLAIFLAEDNFSFNAFEVPKSVPITFKNDVIQFDSLQFNFAGEPINQGNKALKRIQVYQEFWHSWLTFHPNTLKYK